ncbi:MAG: adenylate/guanylate cyclase domain-containing protein, partial [Actinomycetota bacterium]|nr:adenylate/guanylate cyclase domain-containing protein [Actinomycetota bacterium]
TYLLTDVVGSTGLWERSPEAMTRAMVRHDEVVESAVDRFGGEVVTARGEGDSRFAVFARSVDALPAAAALVQELSREHWLTPSPLAVRVAVHTGTAAAQEGEHYGTVVNRAARLRALAHPNQVLVSAAAAADAEELPEALTLQDLGTHRLADLGGPQRVFQLVAPGLEAEFPPLASADRARHNLPHRATTFLGRELELAAVGKALESARLVTVTGPGGTGKTRLAIQAAADRLDAYAHGVWLVELAPAVDDGSVVTAMARSLGVPTSGGSAVDRLAEFLRTRDLLVVLDNCEHVLAAAAALAGRLLRVAPSLRILATSRQSLGVPGEQLLPLGPLDFPDPAHLPSIEELAGYDAVALFGDRARAAQPGFALDADTAATVATVCARLDGIPLAIELAAARLRSLTLNELAHGLEDRFELLAGGGEGSLGHHQTLRATLDWSWALLDPRAAAVARRLAVFPGSFELGAAEAVADDGTLEVWVGDVLSDLVDKSLVVAGHPWSNRYWMLETVRAYAAERLKGAGEEESARDRHLAWAAQLGDRAEPGYREPGQVEFYEYLDTELDDLRAALAWGLDAHRLDGFRLAAGLSMFWWSHGYTAEAVRTLDAYLDAFPDAPPALRGRAHAGAGFISNVMRDRRAARVHLEGALTLAEEYGIDAWWVAFSLGSMGTVVGGDEGIALAARGRELALVRNDPSSAANCCQTLAGLCREAGDFTAATGWLQEALEVIEFLGEFPGRTRMLWSLAELNETKGDLDAAVHIWQQVLDAAERQHDRIAVRGARQFLRGIAVQRGDFLVARRYALDHVDALREEASPDLAGALLDLARVAALGGDRAGGRTAVDEGLARVRGGENVCWRCIARGGIR